MANIATNEVLIIFKKGSSIEERRKVISYIEENLTYDEIYNDMIDEDLENSCINISYGTKWSEQQDILQDICNIFDIKIIGVCYEWGCAYVNAFELSKIE